MKLLVVVCALVAVTCAAPPASSDAQAQVVRSQFDVQPDGAYVFSYETENGINRQENGDLKEALDEENKPHTVVVVRGSYTYTDTEGKPQTITYVADETGYHPEGDSIPKAPASRR